MSARHDDVISNWIGLVQNPKQDCWARRELSLHLSAAGNTHGHRLAPRRSEAGLLALQNGQNRGVREARVTLRFADETHLATTLRLLSPTCDEAAFADATGIVLESAWDASLAAADATVAVGVERRCTTSSSTLARVVSYFSPTAVSGVAQLLLGSLADEVTGAATFANVEVARIALRWMRIAISSSASTAPLTLEALLAAGFHLTIFRGVSTRTPDASFAAWRWMEETGCQLELSLASPGAFQAAASGSFGVWAPVATTALITNCSSCVDSSVVKCGLECLAIAAGSAQRQVVKLNMRTILGSRVSITEGPQSNATSAVLQQLNTVVLGRGLSDEVVNRLVRSLEQTNKEQEIPPVEGRVTTIRCAGGAAFHVIERGGSVFVTFVDVDAPITVLELLAEQRTLRAATMAREAPVAANSVDAMDAISVSERSENSRNDSHQWIGVRRVVAVESVRFIDREVTLGGASCALRIFISENRKLRMKPRIVCDPCASVANFSRAQLRDLLECIGACVIGDDGARSAGRVQIKTPSLGLGTERDESTTAPRINSASAKGADEPLDPALVTAVRAAAVAAGLKSQQIAAFQLEKVSGGSSFDLQSSSNIRRLSASLQFEGHVPSSVVRRLFVRLGQKRINSNEGDSILQFHRSCVYQCFSGGPVWVNVVLPSVFAAAHAGAPWLAQITAHPPTFAAEAAASKTFVTAMTFTPRLEVAQALTPPTTIAADPVVVRLDDLGIALARPRMNGGGVGAAFGCSVWRFRKQQLPPFLFDRDSNRLSSFSIVDKYSETDAAIAESPGNAGIASGAPLFAFGRLVGFHSNKRGAVISLQNMLRSAVTVVPKPHR